MLYENLINNTYWVLKLLFSRPVMSNSLWPHGLQHIRLPCPSPSPGVCPSSCSLHWWCHSAISSLEAFFFCPQSLPASGTFPMSRLHQITKILELPLQHHLFQWIFSDISVNILKIDWFDPGVISSTTIQRHQFFGILPSLWSNPHNHTWPLGRP